MPWDREAPHLSCGLKGREERRAFGQSRALLGRSQMVKRPVGFSSERGDPQRALHEDAFHHVAE